MVTAPRPTHLATPLAPRLHDLALVLMASPEYQAHLAGTGRIHPLPDTNTARNSA